MAFTLLDYRPLFAEPDLRGLMRPTDDPLLLAGPLVQPIRRAMFGRVFYLLREMRPERHSNAAYRRNDGGPKS